MKIFLYIMGFCLIGISPALSVDFFKLFHKKPLKNPYLAYNYPKPLRFGEKPFVINRLNLASHELLVFEVKSVTTEVSPESLVIEADLEDEENAPTTDRSNQETRVIQVPKVKAEVIEVEKSNRLDSQELIPLLLRPNEAIDAEIEIPALIPLQGSSQTIQSQATTEISE